MAKRLTTKLVVAAIFVSGCATTPTVRSRITTSLGPIAIESKSPPPPWLETVPHAAGYHFVMGEAEGASSREQALERAWVSAFVRLGMTEFPELTRISTRGRETLKNSQFERNFAVNLEGIDWTGVKEATELGSPYVIYDRKHSQFIAFRLLKWGASDISNARKNLKTAKRHSLPPAPEASTREQQALVDAVRQVQKLNHRIGYRNAYLDRVFSELKCGVTLEDLTNILGAADRANPYNGHLVEKEFFWGDYQVTSLGDNPAVAVVRKEGATDKRLVCGPASSYDGI